MSSIVHLYIPREGTLLSAHFAQRTFKSQTEMANKIEYLVFMESVFHETGEYAVFDLISVLFAYGILGQKNRPN